MIALLLLFNLWSAQAQNLDVPKLSYNRIFTYGTDSYALGYIVDFHSNGLVFWSFEGQMMLGNDSAENESFGNPLFFSTMRSWSYNEFLHRPEFQSQMVLIHYWSPIIDWQYVRTKTHNLLLDIYPVHPKELPQQRTYKDTYYHDWITKLSPDVQGGFIPGRIVRIGLDGLFWKSFEVLVQVGDSGNNFRKLSVSDPKMVNFILRAMLTGKILNIKYVGLLNAENEAISIYRDYQTPFRITEITITDLGGTKLGASHAK